LIAAARNSMSDSSCPVITLLSDFGLSDSYVAAMKGVILGLCPRARLVDVTHLVAPQAVWSAAYLLASCYRDFPPGTIHLAVVDPGVGSARRALAVRAGGYLFVGPDNGILAMVLEREPEWEARELTHPELVRRPLSATFHGRDLFAPAAARLARGWPFEQLGPPVTPIRPDWLRAVMDQDELRGRIIHFDHFGNAVTNIGAEQLAAFEGGFEVRLASSGKRLPLHRNYAEVPVGQPLAVIGGSGYLELAINCGSARDTLQLDWLSDLRLAARETGSKPPSSSDYGPGV